MSSSNLIRWSGLAALVGGVLMVGLNILEFVLFGSQPDSAAVASSAWIIVEVSWIVVLLLVLLGLWGLYARQAGQAGSLGLIAFLVAFIGAVMVFGSAWNEAFIVPWMVQEAPPEFLEFLDNAEFSGLLLAAYALSYGLFALGWSLLGLASLRARVLPRGSAVLLVIGAVLFLVLAFLELPFWSVVLGAALVWMGYALWSGSGEPALTTKAAM